MADGTNGEVSMNYATLNGKNQWEVLRLYTFQSFENGIYRRDAELETNRDIRYKLADIPLPNGVLRVDKVVTPAATKVRLGLTGNQRQSRRGREVFQSKRCRNTAQRGIPSGFGSAPRMGNGYSQLSGRAASGEPQMRTHHG